MFHVKRLAVIVNDGVCFIHQFINFLYVVIITLIAEVDLLFIQPFSGPTQNPGRLNYLLGRYVRLEQIECIYLV